MSTNERLPESLTSLEQKAQRVKRFWTFCTVCRWFCFTFYDRVHEADERCVTLTVIVASVGWSLLSWSRLFSSSAQFRSGDTPLVCGSGHVYSSFIEDPHQCYWELRHWLCASPQETHNKPSPPLFSHSWANTRSLLPKHVWMNYMVFQASPLTATVRAPRPPSYTIQHCECATVSAWGRSRLQSFLSVLTRSHPSLRLLINWYAGMMGTGQRVVSMIPESLLKD